MDRRSFLKSACATAGLATIFPNAANALYEDCNPAGFCAAGIERAQYMPHARYQQTPVWCWSASLESLFSWYGANVPQASVVSQVYGAVVPASSGDPHMLVHELNRSYTSLGNGTVNIRSRFFSVDLGIQQIGNTDIVNAMRAGKPCIHCTVSHMMVMIGVEYNSYPHNTRITRVMLADPYYQPKFRISMPDEITPWTPGLSMGQMRFFAIPEVTLS